MTSSKRVFLPPPPLKGFLPPPPLNFIYTEFMFSLSRRAPHVRSTGSNNFVMTIDMVDARIVT